MKPLKAWAVLSAFDLPSQYVDHTEGYGGVSLWVISPSRALCERICNAGGARRVAQVLVYEAKAKPKRKAKVAPGFDDAHWKKPKAPRPKKGRK